MTFSEDSAATPLLGNKNKFAGPMKKFVQLVYAWIHQQRLKPIERVLDKISEHAVEDISFAIPEFSGEFYLDARSSIFRRIAREGRYERELTKLCSNLIDRNRDIVDVGANIGLYSVLFAKTAPASRVLAVEPVPAAYERLLKNTKRNDVDTSIVSYNGAVGAETGQMQIKVIDGQEEYSTLGMMAHPSTRGREWRQQAVPLTTLDQLVQQHQLDPGFVKIDVEGFEHLVLRGASKTLTECRPKILAELSDELLRKNGSSAMEVVKFLEDVLDYRCTNPLKPEQEFRAQAYGDVLCIPN